MGFFQTISRYGLLPATTIGNLLTAGAEKITGKKFGRTTTKELSKTKAGKVLGLATLGTAAALATAVAGVPATARAAVKVIPKTPLGKTVALFVGGAAVASPAIRTAIVEAPFRVVEGGIKLGGKIEELPEPIKEKAGRFGVAGLVSAGLIGAGLITAAPLVLGKVKDVIPVPSLIDKEAGVPITDTPPITPETVSLEEPSVITPAKTPTEARRQKISQRVDVRVTGIKRTNKYINVFAHH